MDKTCQKWRWKGCTNVIPNPFQTLQLLADRDCKLNDQCGKIVQSEKVDNGECFEHIVFIASILAQECCKVNFVFTME